MKLKLFVAEHPGRWLPGYSVILAENREEAEKLLTDFLRARGLKTEPLNIIELPTDQARVWLLLDGAD